MCTKQALSILIKTNCMAGNSARLSNGHRFNSRDCRKMDVEFKQDTVLSVNEIIMLSTLQKK